MTLGLTIIAHSVLLFSTDQVPAAVTAVLTGALLVIGLFSAVLAFVVGVLCACALSFALSASYLFDSRLVTLLAGAMGFSIAMLGPGAFSADARLFGPREITIPAATSLHDDGANCMD